MSKLRLLIVSLLVLFCTPFIFAQKAALKTNLLSDAFASINVGGEVALAPKWTLDVSGQLNGWKLSHDRRWKHWLVQPELRYWFCNKFSGHFVGVHLLGGQYNIGGIDIPVNFLGTDFRKLKDSRFQGWFGGAGIAYGYDWVIGHHWNLEAEIGFGWTYTHYDQYPCAVCGKKLDSGHHNYFGPTKAAINITYVF